jgi:hypothetical protein
MNSIKNVSDINKTFKDFYFMIGFGLALILATALGSSLINVLDNLISQL